MSATPRRAPKKGAAPKPTTKSATKDASKTSTAQTSAPKKAAPKKAGPKKAAAEKAAAEKAAAQTSAKKTAAAEKAAPRKATRKTVAPAPEAAALPEKTTPELPATKPTATKPTASKPTASASAPPGQAAPEPTTPATAAGPRTRPQREDIAAARARRRLVAVPDPASDLDDAELGPDSDLQPRPGLEQFVPAPVAAPALGSPATDPATAEVHPSGGPGPAASGAVGQPATSRSIEAPTDLGEIIDLAVNLLRTAAEQAGIPTEDAERQIARLLAFARRRLTGDFTVDEYGHDPDWTEHVYLPVMRLLYRKWFRVEVRGIENIPAEGGALIVANHSGTVAFDSFMTGVAVHDETPNHRTLRMLGADLVFQMPFVGMIARRSGSTLAANSDAERLLNEGQLVGVWPEGFKGVGKRYSERYKLQRFGRGGFVSAALRTGVPIIPCSIVGAEEIYPMIGEMPAVARLLGIPYAPITPTFPWLGLLGLVPLPSKWLIEFGPPIPTDGHPPEGADDPMLVFDLSDRVRETIQQTLYGLLMQRRSIFI